MSSSTTMLFTLSLHDALPIFGGEHCRARQVPLPDPLPAGERLRARDALDVRRGRLAGEHGLVELRDRKSTRLNSSHMSISYAVFCLKKKTLWFPLLPSHTHLY